MERNVNVKLILGIMCAVIIIMLTVAFAHFSRMLKSAGQGKVDPANFDIHFKNLSEPVLHGGAEVTGTPTIESEGASISNIAVTLKLPGDYVQYTVDIENSGDINTKISNIEKEIDCNQMNSEDLNEIFEFSVYYTDTENQLQLNDELQPSDRKNITIKIKYKDIEDPDLLPNEVLTIDLSYRLTYEQSNNKALYYASGLPTSYTPVEYLESTGTQWIDTGYIPKINTIVELDVSFDGSFNKSDGSIFAAKDSGNAFSLNFGNGNTYNNTLFIWGNRTYSSGGSIENIIITDAIRTNRNTIRMGMGSFSYGTVSRSISMKTSDNITSLILFGDRTESFKSYYMVVYGFRVYEGNTLIHNFIPALDPSGTPCMYDTVTKEPFYNQGTGEFLTNHDYYANGLPKTYTPVDYLESTGTQYIDTGYKLSTNSKIEAEYYLNNNPSFSPFGSFDINSSPYVGFTLYTNSDTTRFGYFSTSSDNKYILNEKAKLIYSINGLYQNSTFIYNISSNYVKSKYNCYLFARNVNNTPTGLGSIRFYFFRILDNNELIHNFIPALDPTGRPCMYDTVTKQPFYNQGTGEFLYSLKDTNE